MSLYPLTFHPIFKERVWGGRKLEGLYGKKLPPGVPIGESWEISDRPGDASVIANGPLRGKDLHWLMDTHRKELLGNDAGAAARFPLLIKILDAQETLSLQVHPPADKATVLNGESKTEMWYVAQARPGAELFAGLKRGITREEFERKIKAGTVADCLHRLRVKSGDVMFLPSGRVHALGAGLVIFEIQQNSDTTYRVFDWNRVGLDGKPRALHVEQSLESIDFDDFEPELVSTPFSRRRNLVTDPLFSVEAVELAGGETLPLKSGKAQVLAVLAGQLRISHDTGRVELSPGQFCLLPAAIEGVTILATHAASSLRIQPETI